MRPWALFAAMACAAVPTPAVAADGLATAAAEGGLVAGAVVAVASVLVFWWRYRRLGERVLVRERELRGTMSELRDSEARYRQLVEMSPDPIFVHDDHILFANSAALRLFGAARAQDFIGKPTEIIVHPDDRAEVRERTQRTLATDQPNPLTRRLAMRLDGSTVQVETTSAAVELPGGRRGVQVVARDVSDRIGAEISLRESEAKFRAIFENSLEAIGVSKSGKHHFVNAAYLRLFGYERPEELLGRPIGDIIAPADRGRVSDIVRRRVLGETVPVNYESRGVRRDGGEFDLDIHASTYSENGEVHTVAMLRDITGRKREQEARVRAAIEREQVLDRAQVQLEHLPIACIVLDGEFRVSSWNRAAERLFGWLREEAVGRHPFDLYVPPERRATVDELFERLGAGEVAVGDEGEGRTKDGGEVACRWINTPVHASDGAFIGAMAMAWDVTEQRQLEDQLRQAQKMEAVGQLAGGVAHDFNNLLTVITGYGQMLLEHQSLGGPQRRSAEQILKAAGRAAALTRQLLAFSRRQVLQPKVLDLNAVVTELEKLMRPLIGEDIAVALTLASTLGRVRADPGQFEQVIMNLAVNARDAMPQGGTLTIETANVDFAAEATHPREPGPGHWVMLAVRDTGCGMDQATLKHLFEPFFTTKEPGKGTGLGLATVYGIVKQSGGNVLVYSEPGKGASFEIYLPRIDAVADGAPGPADGIAENAGDETVLLVEDDPDVLELARSTLGRGGYRVLAARDGESAIALATSHAGDIDLALCDVIMPGMSGRDVVDRLRSQRPDLRAMFMSGYADKAIVTRGVLAPGVVLIEKPFSAHALLRKVREVLDAQAS
jgi:PAS domain S-box-containing protein